MIKMIVFWKNDTFPYCLHGELNSIIDDYITVKGYEGMRFRTKSVIAIMHEPRAKEFIQSLEDLKFERREILLAYDDKVNAIIREISAWK